MIVEAEETDVNWSRSMQTYIQLVPQTLQSLNQGFSIPAMRGANMVTAHLQSPEHGGWQLTRLVWSLTQTRPGTKEFHPDYGKAFLEYHYVLK